MADQDFKHTVEIMKAALPYVDGRTQSTTEFFIKMFDLMDSLKAMTSSKNMAACGYENGTINMEGLLTGIRPLCDGKERAFVDRILGIFNAKRMFEMYNNYMSMMKTMQEFGGFSSTDSENSDNSDAGFGNFQGFDFSSLFKDYTTGTSNSTDTNTDADIDADIDADTGINTPKDDPTNIHSDTSTDTPSSSNMFGNNGMMEMLKAMVPPEQMSTFENLSMLLNTMSYDNNSKPDDGKESNDG